MRIEVHTHSKKALGTWKVSAPWASATTGIVALVAPLGIFVLAGFGGAAGGLGFTLGGGVRELRLGEPGHSLRQRRRIYIDSRVKGSDV